MAQTITHAFVSTIADDITNPQVVRPSNWNASHVISGAIDATQLPVQAARLDLVDQVVTGGANVNSVSLTTGNVTIDCGQCPLQFINNAGAFNITAPTTDGSCMVLVTNVSGAGAIGFPGFSFGANVGDSLDTTVGHKFTISIWRINGTSGYRVAAHQ